MGQRTTMSLGLENTKKTEEGRKKRRRSFKKKEKTRGTGRAGWAKMEGPRNEECQSTQNHKHWSLKKEKERGEN